MTACKNAHSFAPLLHCHTMSLNAFSWFSASQTFHRNDQAQDELDQNNKMLMEIWTCAALNTSFQFQKLATQILRAELNVPATIKYQLLIYYSQSIYRSIVRHMEAMNSI